MTGRVLFSVPAGSVVLPLDEMAVHLRTHDPSPTFGGAREMYAGNVYLRGFRPGLTARTIVDLGSNRGLFVALAAKVLGADRGVSVEPEGFYLPVYEALLAANDIDIARFPRVQRFASASVGPETVTLGELMQTHGLDEIDFLKCDIEGGEFDVMGEGAPVLSAVKNIAMELHPAEGDVGALVRRLQAQGFAVRITDQFGADVTASDGHYLYASRDGSLAETRA